MAPLPLAAAKLIPKQLRINPANLEAIEEELNYRVKTILPEEGNTRN